MNEYPFKKPSLLDEAQLKAEFRALYKEIGFDGALQALHEILIAGEWLSQVLMEEMTKENKRDE